MQEHFHTINDLSLCVCTVGVPTKPAIVILHGWLDHAGSWEKVARHLSQHYFVLILDQRGHGKSAHIPLCSHYHFPDYVADLQQIIDDYQLSDFILIGHSMGGTVASLYSSLCEPRPRKLILIEGLGPRHETEKTAKERYQQHLSQRKKNPTHLPITSVDVAATKLRRFHGYLTKEQSYQLAQRILIRTPNGYQWRWDPRHKDKAAISFHLSRHQEILANIKSPTSLIFGQDSWYLQLPDLSARINSFSVPVDLHYIESGHSPHLQCPEILSKLLANIL